MKATELRNAFVDFFKKRGHTFVPSDNLIPKNDHTILFTNAGMNQFKDVFLDKGKREYSRAVNYQKCMRVSGKHNDLEEVGRDHTHHTFFEMMGNWSFGDYYKEEAIAWAWEFLTVDMKLPVENIWITIHDSDDESCDIWKKVSGFGEDRIVRFGDKENFWEMGATGPCGPCTEIHFDRGEQYSCSDKCRVNCSCGRFVEIWNNVFIQYSRIEDGSLHPLPRKHVDTGLGFERTLAILNGQISNYNTDVFTPIIRRIEELSGLTYQENEETGIAFRVICDHIRALTFTITDGVMFSNDGQGYVIRKILRRAQRFGKKLGFEEPFLNRLVETVVETMQEAYPELKDKKSYVVELITGEEERFLNTLKTGLEQLYSFISGKDADYVLEGDIAFRLYDTYGFPLEVTKDVCIEMGYKVDEAGFYTQMEMQKERARAAHAGKSETPAHDFYVQMLIDGAATLYCGEDHDQRQARLIAIVKDGSQVEHVNEGETAILLFDETPFYGEGGGQVGDTGSILESGEVIAEVSDSRRFEGKLILHEVRVKSRSGLKKGSSYLLKIDTVRRQAIRKNHTATHLLQAALRKVIGNHVTQAGSKVGPDTLRFDYTHHTHTDASQLAEIEKYANELILKDYAVGISKMPILQAKKLGAMALFDEKYDDVVRVIDISGMSIELCGGSHVSSTGEIGLLKVCSDTAIASGVRRIEATAGLASLERFQKLSNTLDSVSSHLICKPDEILERIQKLEADNKALKKQIKSVRDSELGSNVEKLIENVRTAKGVSYLTHEFEGQSPDSMLGLIDRVIEDRKDLIILFANRSEDSSKVQLFLKVGEKLTDRFHAGRLIKEISRTVGGGGGGKADMAQAGGTQPGNIGAAFSKLEELL